MKCVIVGKPLVTSICPLGVDAKGHQCAWRHRTNGVCTYSDEFAASDPTPQDIARRVGEVIPSEKVVEGVKARIVSLFQKQ